MDTQLQVVYKTQFPETKSQAFIKSAANNNKKKRVRQTHGMGWGGMGWTAVLFIRQQFCNVYLGEVMAESIERSAARLCKCVGKKRQVSGVVCFLAKKQCTAQVLLGSKSTSSVSGTQHGTEECMSEDVFSPCHYLHTA